MIIFVAPRKWSTLDLERNGSLCMAIKPGGEKGVTSIVLTKLQKQKREEQTEKLGIGVSALIRLAVSEWLEARAGRA